MDEFEQQFNLRWHSHQGYMAAALTRMYSGGFLTDVTLSASGTVLRAHRLVLAACSQYFAQLFKEVELDTNTLVVVLGCEAAELKLLLSFMYNGEVTASKSNLPALLRLAKTLKVAGLTDPENPPITPSDPESFEDQDTLNSPINLETRTDQNEGSTVESNNNFSFNFEELTGNIDKGKQNDSDSAALFGGKCEERMSKLDQIVQNLYTTHRIDAPISNVPITPPVQFEDPETYEKKWRLGSICPICNKQLSNQYNLRVHMETHSGGRHACRTCSHVSRSRDALRKHVAYRHPNVPSIRGVIPHRKK